ncbi:hypothetical protein BU24DRAFT_151907 [Aaosphaeria arxii CBS 175.79]|uniref:Peptidase A1 domain-containing protein n=1 Tax=Aaosphaeria arxii CBS 175.79 TaxID=1450172 RepID=A0A6A5XXZ6_9PLEO|nr:uncharacterized protein BU24DRAFT_151907 [Aaosphaeria arxii CBS 175.79]KAF2017510.1 hypothetical protein BU24DRAFT_151907 [Aaosphaeria arxii CBS 175.79]
MHSPVHLFLLLSAVCPLVCSQEGLTVPPLYPFVIPVYGPSDENSSLPEIPAISGIGIPDRSSSLDMFRIFINDTTPSKKTPAFQRAIVDASKRPLYLVTVADEFIVTLGLNANLTAVASLGYNESDPVNVTTVPFGLNIGRKDVFNGSISLNGNYDANRINSTSWINLGLQKSFLERGTLNVTANVHSMNGKKVIETNATTILIDFNSPAITLPKGHNCTDLHISSLDSNSASSIHISDYLIANETRCQVSSNDGENSKVILGRPFFQATYLYAEKDGSVFLAQANDYKLPPKAEKFDKQGKLQPPTAPEGYVSPGKSSGTIMTVTMSNVFLAALLVILWDLK